MTEIFYYQTIDGEAFYTESSARNYAKSLTNKRIVQITKSEWEASRIENGELKMENGELKIENAKVEKPQQTNAKTKK